MAAVALLLLCASSAAAQSALDRRVSLHARDVALSAALDRVAALADVRISYSRDLLPSGARVTVARDSVRLEEVLRDLLRGTPLRAVAVASDHVVLAAQAVQSAEEAPAPSAALLEGITVRSADALARRRADATTTVSGDALERRNITTVAQLLNGAVPGMWMWDGAPSTLLGQYGSVRGAASFGVTHPKVYLDGVELANPLLFTQLDAALLERVEVIKGPHGSARYGADAASGVIHLVSRHGAPPEGARATMESAMGWTRSTFGPSTAVQQHTMGARIGDSFRSAGIALRGATSGNYVPNAYTRELQAIANGRLIAEATAVTATARLQHTIAGVPANPLLGDDGIARGIDPRALAMYGVGATVSRTSSDDLAYTFTAGMDGYRLRNVAGGGMGFRPASDSALHSAAGGSDRITLRATSVRRHGGDGALTGAFTFGAEQSLLRDATVPDEAFMDSLPRHADWTASAGVLAQADLSLREAVYLTFGTRVQRLAAARREAVVALLPSAGLAIARDVGVATAKARASFGKGIRSPNPGMRLLTRGQWPFASDDALGTEAQSGTEVGVDLLLPAGGLHLTRFDQLASTTTAEGLLGSISNSGWEAGASVRTGRLTIGGTATITDSRVRSTGDAYGGELRAGDRMLGVPKHTGSLSVDWESRRWSTSWTVTRAANWINYDRLALASAPDSLVSSSEGAGSRGWLRDYWMEYPGSARLRGSFVVQLPRGLALSVTGENLTNQQLGEPDSITIVPGRAITLGLRAKF